MLSLKERITILLQIARGMSFLHSKGVIHRDLKCENILMDDHMCAKIADLGISKVTESNASSGSSSSGSSSSASSGIKTPVMTMAVGTSGFIAPEVYKSESYNNKCDVFSFSIIMYQVLFNILRPYGNNTLQVEYRVASDENFRPQIPLVSELGGGELSEAELSVVRIMKNCWKADPMARPSFIEICEELEQVLTVLWAASRLWTFFLFLSGLYTSQTARLDKYTRSCLCIWIA